METQARKNGASRLCDCSGPVIRIELLKEWMQLQYVGSSKGAKLKKMPIPCHDVIRFTFQRTFEHPIIIRIPQNDGRMLRTWQRCLRIIWTESASDGGRPNFPRSFPSSSVNSELEVISMNSAAKARSRNSPGRPPYTSAEIRMFVSATTRIIAAVRGGIHPKDAPRRLPYQFRGIALVPVFALRLPSTHAGGSPDSRPCSGARLPEIDRLRSGLPPRRNAPPA